MPEDYVEGVFEIVGKVVLISGKREASITVEISAIIKQTTKRYAIFSTYPRTKEFMSDDKT
jgi:hypothetical protein